MKSNELKANKPPPFRKKSDNLVPPPAPIIAKPIKATYPGNNSIKINNNNSYNNNGMINSSVNIDNIIKELNMERNRELNKIRTAMNKLRDDRLNNLNNIYDSFIAKLKYIQKKQYC